MIPIISVVGRSDSGKTTLIEKLIPELNRRGYRVGTIKHDVHGFDIDHPGKDSWRHAKAGAELVLISSPTKAAMVKRVDAELTLDEIAGRYVSDVDLVLTEGFKRESKPKIEIRRGAEEPLSSPDEVLFVVAEKQAVSEDDVPILALADISGMADLIERHIKQAPTGVTVSLEVDGRQVPLNAIMQRVITNTTIGLIESLKGVGSPKSVRISIVPRGGRR